jgi:hypothetical protein
MRHAEPRAFAICLAAAFAVAPAAAASYPVSGHWTYNYSTEKGPAEQCGSRRMEFSGDQRRDTGGGVPAYRNVSVTSAGTATFRIVDEFATGQINAQLEYSLRLIDDDHLEIKLASGPTILLRRCA